MKRIMLAIISLLSISALAACGGGGSTYTSDDVIAAFTKAGLEVEDAVAISKEDMGIVPAKFKEGKRFSIPSAGEAEGGRVFAFDNDSDLTELKEFFGKIGEEGTIFFTRTADKGNILIQITGRVEEELFNKYKAALESL
ncbi:hypothetical protein K0T92_14825 [Paenibacillus oenotherae]|uniref:Stress protein n=1 Tax=Paenibacillus oenotherae TaxID=1435645 RepID=A0ABS7DA30_9BACL|nr:hypothetical protein [Paenibacillus oenotherae]MBW7476018.1 hypothetical protein [Paenibacillus oenotherae]